MSATRYLNELELERREIAAIVPITPAEKMEWWDRLADWWYQRDLGFGDGKGMISHCRAMADRQRQIIVNSSYFCGDTATQYVKEN